MRNESAHCKKQITVWFSFFFMENKTLHRNIFIIWMYKNPSTMNVESLVWQYTLPFYIHMNTYYLKDNITKKMHFFNEKHKKSKRLTFDFLGKCKAKLVCAIFKTEQYQTKWMQQQLATRRGKMKKKRKLYIFTIP